MSVGRNKRWAALALAAWALGGCDKDGDDDKPPAGPEAEPALRRMADCDDLSLQIEDSVVELLAQSRYGYYGGGVYWETDDAAADGGAGTPGSPTDFTTTNVQEQGVDELDLVKTDGDYLYIAQDKGVQIVKSWPAAETELVAQMDLDGWASGLFLAGDKLVVFSNVNDAITDVDGLAFHWFYGTRVSVIDVSDRSNPMVERTIDIEGYASDARMVDGKVYFVINQWMDVPPGTWELTSRTDLALPDYPAWDAPQAEWDEAMDAARDVYRPLVHELMADLDLDAYLPQWRERADATFTGMYACDDIYAPQQQTPLAMLAVGQLDPETGALGATGVMSQGWTVYASTSNLYVAQTSRWWWGWGGYDKSHIHKFALGGSEPVYTASGSVDGWLYDQFAMSEYQGDLRVVTTDLTSWGGVVAGGGGGGTVDPATTARVDAAADQEEEDTDLPPPPANNVFVLSDDGQGTLDVVGHVGGIAPNEQVYAVRMIGDKGYVVTFRQTDPLFTLDLSDPTHPTVAGALVMPGYSAYLHPIDDDHLLAVGMSGTETGQLTGLAINLFDVSDLANPTLLHHHDVEPGPQQEGVWVWSYSEALWDHHAFTYGRDTLTIPAYTQRWVEATQSWTGFSGAISFHVSVADGISENGRVDHQALVDRSRCLYDWWWGRTDGAEPVLDGSYCDWDYGYWYAQVRRSVYVEDNLYTVSDYGVMVNDLDDPSVEIAAVPFYPIAFPAP